MEQEENEDFQVLSAIYLSNPKGSLIGCVLHELRWDDWFLGRPLNCVLNDPQLYGSFIHYGFLIIPKGNPYWSDEFAMILRDKKVYINVLHHSMSLDEISKYLAMGMSRQMEIHEEEGNLEQWLRDHAALVVKREQVVCRANLIPVTDYDYNVMRTHAVPIIEAAQECYLDDYQ
jgi:hypothetical protein